jgi:hypothetical protein
MKLADKRLGIISHNREFIEYDPCNLAFGNARFGLVFHRKQQVDIASRWFLVVGLEIISSALKFVRFGAIRDRLDMRCKLQARSPS